MRVELLGVGFDNVNMNEAVERGVEMLLSEGAHYVVTPNPEIVETCRENPAAKEAVNSADLVIADGIGVVVVIKNRVRVCNDLCYLINGYAYHAFCGISIVIAECIMSNCPDEFPNIGNIILTQQCPKCLEYNLLRQILCVLGILTPLKSKAKYGFKIFSCDSLCVLILHLFVPH